MIADPLETDTVRVRWLFVDSADLGRMASLRHMLGVDELQRADRFHFAADREAFTAAHALARAMLSQATGKPTDIWRYAEGEFGKPELAAPHTADGLRFNISHTRGLVACALARSELGVDVESSDRPTHPGLANSVFAPEETSVLKAAPADRQASLFFRFWTLKEAFIKATGEGLHRPLHSFSFALDPVRIQFHPERDRAPRSDDPMTWRFAEFQPAPNKHLALAIRFASQDAPQMDARVSQLEEIVAVTCTK